jgi:hypothetical protein
MMLAMPARAAAVASTCGRSPTYQALARAHAEAFRDEQQSARVGLEAEVLSRLEELMSCPPISWPGIDCPAIADGLKSAIYRRVVMMVGERRIRTSQLR